MAKRAQAASRDGKRQSAAPSAEVEGRSAKRRKPAAHGERAEVTGELSDIPCPGPGAGHVYVYGTGDCGQLGLGEDVLEKAKPAVVVLPGSRKAICAVAGGMHTAVLAEDGTVYTWGVNDEGALGRYTEGEAWKNSGEAEGKPGDAWTPGPVAMPPHAPRVVALSAGDSHTAALTIHGSVYAWGTYRDSGGVMGFSATQRIAVLPTLIWQPSSEAAQVVALASGTDHVAALTRGGAVLTWGSGQQGQLGRTGTRWTGRRGGGRLADLLTPQPMHLPFRLPARAAAVACGSYATFVVLADGAVLACGLNNYGQLGAPPGRGAAAVHLVPRRVAALAGRPVTAVASGEHHTLALARDGAVLAFGRPTYGRLGVPAADAASDTGVPEAAEAPVAGLVGAVAGVAAGAAVSGVFSSQECGLCACGFGTNGQLGKGGDDDGDEPVLRKVGRTQRFQGLRVVALGFGGQHAVVLAVPLEAPAPA